MSHTLTHKSTFATHMLITHNFTKEELQYILDSRDTITRKVKHFRRVSITSVTLREREVDSTKFKVEVFCDIYNGLIFTVYLSPNLFEIGNYDLFHPDPNRRPLFRS